MRFCEEWIPNLGYFGLIASKVTRNLKTWPTLLFSPENRLPAVHKFTHGS